MKYLINTVETYRVDTEPEAEALITEAKNDVKFILSKYTCQKKEDKKIDDEYYIVTLNKVFNDVKDPISEVAIDYEVN